MAQFFSRERIMMPGTNPEGWEIWYACVSFEEDSTLDKLRPALILPNTSSSIQVYKISSQPWKYETEYPIFYWQLAGLSKPSNIDIRRAIVVPSVSLVKFVGRLHLIDLYHLKEMMAQLNNGYP